MRRVLLAFIGSLILMSVSSFAAEIWYQTYAEALQLLRNGNWLQAEQKLKLSIQQGPKQSRTAVSENGPVVFIPDYYLGIVYWKTGKYKAAIDQFERVQSNGLVVEGTAEFQQMNPLRESAKKRLEQEPREIAALVKNITVLTDARQFEQAKANLKAAMARYPDNVDLKRLWQEVVDREKAPAAPVRNDEELFVTQIARFIKEGKLTSAKNVCAKAKQQFPQSEQVQTLEAQIQEIERKYTRMIDNLLTEQDFTTAREAMEIAKAADRSNPLYQKLLVELQKKEAAFLNQMRSVDGKIYKGILAFYSGHYTEAIRDLESIQTATKDPSKVYFYLGCSYAGLALLSKNNQQSLAEKAQQYFLKVRKMNSDIPFHNKFISPRIARLYLQKSPSDN